MTNSPDNISTPSTSEETTILGEGKREIAGDIKRAAQKAYSDGVAKGYDDGMVLDVVALLEQAILAERKRISRIVMDAWIKWDERPTMTTDDVVKEIFREMEGE